MRRVLPALALVLAALLYFGLRGDGPGSVEERAHASERRDSGAAASRGPLGAASARRSETPPASTERPAGPGLFATRRTAEVVALGEAAPGLEPAAVAAALASERETLRHCVEASGGMQILDEAMRASGTNWRRRRLDFDVAPDGRAAPESIAFDGAFPASFARCFEDALLSAHFDQVGADGARVSVPLAVFRRALHREGDGGVPLP